MEVSFGHEPVVVGFGVLHEVHWTVHVINQHAAVFSFSVGSVVKGYSASSCRFPAHIVLVLVKLIVNVMADGIQLILAYILGGVGVFEEDGLCVVDFPDCLFGKSEGDEFLCIAEMAGDGCLDLYVHRFGV